MWGWWILLMVVVFVVKWIYGTWRFGRFMAGFVDMHDPNTRDSTGFSPLHRAAMIGDREFLELFIADGADVDKLAVIGVTPLHCAVMHGNLMAVKLLVSAGADAFVLDADGLSAVEIAVAGGHQSIADYLTIQAGAVEAPEWWEPQPGRSSEDRRRQTEEPDEGYADAGGIAEAPEGGLYQFPRHDVKWVISDMPEIQHPSRNPSANSVPGDLAAQPVDSNTEHSDQRLQDDAGPPSGEGAENVSRRQFPRAKMPTERFSEDRKAAVLKEVKRYLELSAKYARPEREVRRERHRRLERLLELVVEYSRDAEHEGKAGSTIDLVSMATELDPEELLESVVLAGMMRSISPAVLMSYLDFGADLDLSPREIYERARERAADRGRSVPGVEGFMAADPFKPDGDGATVETALHFPQAQGYGEEVGLVKRYMSEIPSLMHATVSMEPLVSFYDTAEHGRIFFRYHHSPMNFLTPSYPKPERPFPPGSFTGYEQLGWNRGSFPDGRPFLAESWAKEMYSAIDFYFSAQGLENATDAKVGELLVDSGLVEVVRAEPIQPAVIVTDDAGQRMWSVKIVMTVQGDPVATSALEFAPYPPRSGA
jgi:hypothetical protein